MREKAGKSGKQNKKRLLPFLAAAVLALLVSGGMARAALENEKDASVRSVHMRDGDIEESTLAIGSHLIHINALTGELYQIALESANEFNQNQIYYKSELAGGAWFEISDATSIADITSSGTPVGSSVIEALEFTHQTKSDGITIDLRTGGQVSVYDINDPYDLRVMAELEPLKLQYQILQEKTDKNDSDEIYLEMIGELFDQDIQDDTTRDCDVSLSALESYKNGLSPREKPALWTEKTEEIMTAVDAERRVAALTNLAELLDELENDASGMGESIRTEGGGSEEDGEEEEQPDFLVNSEIVAAVGDSIQNVEESITSYEAKRISGSGETASAEAEYRYQQEFIVRARGSDTPGCDEMMEMLCNLQNILDGVIADQDSELNTLTSDLLAAAFGKYTADLREGASEDYQRAQSEGGSEAVLSVYLSEQKAKANADRLEYQTLLSAQFERMENTAAQSYVLQLIDGVPQMEASVLQDAAEPYLKETVDEHLIWLRSAYAELVRNASDSTEMATLEQEKEELAKQRQDALDHNDLAGANRLTAEMEAKQNDIDALTESLNAILTSPDSSEADKAKAAAEMGGGSAASLLSSMADTLSSAIRSSDADDADLSNQLAALAAAAQLDPSAGAAALTRVQDALDQATELDADIKDSLEGSVTDAKSEISESLAGADGAGGAGAAAGRTLTEDELSGLLGDILDKLFGGGFEELSSAQQAGAMIAVEWYGERKGSGAALNLAASLAKQAAQSRNPYLYDKYQEKKEGCLSLQALGRVTGCRYIFDDQHNTVTLQKGKEYYLFTLGKKRYETTGGTMKELDTPPVFQKTLYIESGDGSKLFEAKAEYIEKAQYGAVGTVPVETLAGEIYEKLTEGGA